MQNIPEPKKSLDEHRGMREERTLCDSEPPLKYQGKDAFPDGLTAKGPGGRGIWALSGH